ncbi:transporter [Luteolibacter sp. LG18]|uniref:transporter n=1 Tax=Luteolibacter sp. LG18 TaxID=2819286 RepID=UPI002B2EAAF3|nr:hypothetical protein llg_38800 [Luteolibacter sp. LG18]
MIRQTILAFAATAAFATAAEFKRELSPDRPDTTESPVTVEPGAIQLESSFWSFTRDKDAGITTETWTLGETNVKFGITECSDLQLVLRPWVTERAKGFGMTDRAEGFGDIEVRWKQNLWGNDGGKTAFGLMPFVSIPTQTEVSTGEWEGGLIAPLSIELCDGMGLGLMAEVDRVWDSDKGRHEWDFVHTAVLGFDLTDSLGLYVEYIGNTGHGSYEATASAGLTWGQTENLQWDVGFTVGLNDAAEDFGLFQGVTFRF